MVEEAVESLFTLYVLPIGLSVLWGLAVALIALLVFRIASIAIARSRVRAREVVGRVATSLFVLVFIVGAWSAATIMRVPSKWEDPLPSNIHHIMQIVTIIAAAYLLFRIVMAVSDWLLAHYKTDKATERRARRVQMQVQLLRRIVAALIVVIAVGAVLFTFEGARAAGASVLASAGLISVIAGIAATSALTNVFAGMQLAFSGAINMHDIVVVEGEWGTIEEITLTYVVVHIWDDRRLVLPSTYFTSTPFANWTRTDSDIMGQVMLDVDWSIPVQEMREEMKRIVEASEIWDGRVAVLQVNDAQNGMVKIRVIVSVADGAIMNDLVSHVREELVTWVREVHPESMPYQRVRMTSEELPKPTRKRGQATDSMPRQGLFTGSAEAEARRESFTKPMDIIDQEDLDELEQQ
ncbi:mechanosensitive ion channel family protein [Agrococcus casei]|uniref:mechanosensitive ion channel family protein n=1 Tax=Agrococcus casei TaxID=343512 RepID=UPI003F8F6A21